MSNREFIGRHADKIVELYFENYSVNQAIKIIKENKIGENYEEEKEEKRCDY